MRFICSLLLLMAGALVAQEGPAGQTEGLSGSEKRARAFRENQIQQGQIKFNYALRLKEAGHSARARELLESIVLLHPNHPASTEIYSAMAEIFLEAGQIEYAISWYKRAYREGRHKEPGARAYLQAGQLASEAGETEDARKIFQELMEQRKFESIAREAETRLNSLRVLDLYDGNADDAKDGSDEAKKG